MTVGPLIDGVDMIGGFSKELVDYYSLNEEAKNSLPSRFMKAYLDSDEYWTCFVSNRDKGWNSYPTWSSLQLLTIAYFFMFSRKRVRFIRRIATETDCSPEEKTLMQMCAKDLAKNKYRGKITRMTEKYFNKHFHKKLGPYICDEPLFLPIFFKPGDIICARRKKRNQSVYFIVVLSPNYDTDDFRGAFHAEEYAVLKLSVGFKLLVEPTDDERFHYWTAVCPEYAEPVPDLSIPTRFRKTVERLREKSNFGEHKGGVIPPALHSKEEMRNRLIKTIEQLEEDRREEKKQ